jgi:hypothetical protein
VLTVGACANMLFLSCDCHFIIILFDSSLLGLENLPDLEDLESKLNAYYAKVEKDTGLSKG